VSVEGVDEGAKKLNTTSELDINAATATLDMAEPPALTPPIVICDEKHDASIVCDGQVDAPVFAVVITMPVRVETVLVPLLVESGTERIIDSEPEPVLLSEPDTVAELIVTPHDVFALIVKTRPEPVAPITAVRVTVRVRTFVDAV